MRTSELAGRAGVNSETLRYYERRGLLTEPPRTSGGYRDYPDAAVELLRFIKRAQELGFTLDEVEELLHLGGGGPGQLRGRPGAGRRPQGRSGGPDRGPTADAGLTGRAGRHLRPAAGRPQLSTAGRDRGSTTPPRAVDGSMSGTLEVLHVPDCPNLPPLLERLREATDLPVTTREITSGADAAAAGVTGSPTLLINGRDPFPPPSLQGRGCGVSCRIYRDEHGQAVPAPSVTQLRDAVNAAGFSRDPCPLAGTEGQPAVG
jgi:DNA-binding transcriptional MerR regulator